VAVAAVVVVAAAADVVAMAVLVSPPVLRVQTSYPAFGRDSCKTHGHALDACLPHQRSHICDRSNAEKGAEGPCLPDNEALSLIGLLRRPISKKNEFPIQTIRRTSSPDCYGVRQNRDQRHLRCCTVLPNIARRGCERRGMMPLRSHFGDCQLT